MSEALRLVAFGPNGQPSSTIELPLPEGPEEQFRPIQVGPDGALYQLECGRDGAVLRRTTL